MSLIEDLFTQTRGDLVFVMDLAHYRQIRKAFWNDGDDRDPETAEPDPGDRLIGYPIDVRPDGGQPHIEWMVAK